jgi:RNA polymerase sigma-70 factor (ECF subfamily)
MELILEQSRLHTSGENELVHRIAAGEQDALRELYAVYGQRLYAYALRMLSDPSSAEDVVQESLIAVWHSAKRFRGEGRVIAWLLGIVHNKALNALRKPAASSLEEIVQEPPDPLDSPDDQVVNQEQQQLVRDSLDNLSLEHRLVLELVFYQGLTLKEVADVVNCPVGTVKSRLSYAKTSLKRVLNRGGLAAEDVE